MFLAAALFLAFFAPPALALGAVVSSADGAPDASASAPLLSAVRGFFEKLSPAVSVRGLPERAYNKFSLLREARKANARIAERLTEDVLGAHTYAQCSAGCPAGLIGGALCRVSCSIHTAPDCHDGVDNDSDGKIDYPNDTGCINSFDLGEGTLTGGGLGDLFCLFCKETGGDDPAGPDAPDFDLTIGGAGGPIDVPGNAYETTRVIQVAFSGGPINPNGCETSQTAGYLTSGWLNSAAEDEPYTGTKNIAVTISAPEEQTFTLECDGPGGTHADSITVEPDWDTRIDEFRGPPKVFSRSTPVNLSWRGNDLKTCEATNWGGPSPSSLRVRNFEQNQLHQVDVSPISQTKTYTLACTGFDDTEITKEWTVEFDTEVRPYFFINNINLVIVGPGSGGRSNKATISVTPGGGFQGNALLSAEVKGNPESQALADAGPEFHFFPVRITCNAGGCSTAEFWVTLAEDVPEGVYTIVITAEADGEEKTRELPLRIRKFVPAFEEI